MQLNILHGFISKDNIVSLADEFNEIFHCDFFD